MPAKKTPRRAKGEGTVWRDPSGIWRGCVELPRKPGENKRRRVQVRADTKGEVINSITRLKAKSLDGVLPEPSVVTVGEFIDEWLKTSGSRTIGESTKAGYERYVRLHIKATIGHIRLQKLTPLAAEQVMSVGKSQRTKQQALAILSKALDQAVKWGMAIRNVCDDIDRPKVPRHEIQPLTAEQARLFLKAVRGNEYETLFVLAIGTGARQGELLALKDADFDKTKATLSIQRALALVDGKLTIKEPKTSKSRRRIELDAHSLQALLAHPKWKLKNGRAGFPWLFCGAAGAFVDRFAMLREFRRILKRSKLPRIRFHDLRHTNATLLLLAGVHPKIVQERLGHSSIGITLDLYSHVLPAMQSDAVARLNKLIG